MREQTCGGNNVQTAWVLSQSGELNGLFAVDLNFNLIQRTLLQRPD